MKKASGRFLGLRKSSKLDRWIAAGCPMPAPPEVKRGVLVRYGSPSGVWVETGTLFGDTTAFLADAGAAHVYSVEASPELFQKASDRFSGSEKVTIINGLAEDVLPKILPGLVGPVSFWLDGHYSGGETFQGPLDTPIREEFAAISEHLERLGDVAILVDDFRCFGSVDFPQYPARSWLVDWASSRGLNWTVEHDIFVAGNALS